MSKRILTIAIAAMMAYAALQSCGYREGDRLDRNLRVSVIAHLDTIPDVEYVGHFDTEHPIENGQQLLRAGIIYHITDSAGNRVERNARVTTNADGTEIISWEELDCQTLSDVKQQVADRFHEAGIDIDGDFIEELLKLKRL